MALLQTMAREWPFFQTLLSNMDMVLAKSDIGIAVALQGPGRGRAIARRRSLPAFATNRSAPSRLCSRSSSSARCWSAIPALARTIRDRFPYIDPLNHVQLELLKRYRAGDTDERVVQAIHLTINGIAAGLRNSG